MYVKIFFHWNPQLNLINIKFRKLWLKHPSNVLLVWKDKLMNYSRCTTVPSLLTGMTTPDLLDSATTRMNREETSLTLSTKDLFPEALSVAVPCSMALRSFTSCPGSALRDPFACTLPNSVTSEPLDGPWWEFLSTILLRSTAYHLSGAVILTCYNSTLECLRMNRLITSWDPCSSISTLARWKCGKPTLVLNEID